MIKDFKLVFRKQANEYVHDWMSSVQQTKTQLAEKHNQILDQQPLLSSNATFILLVFNSTG